MNDKIPVQLGKQLLLFTIDDAEKAGDGDLIKGISIIRKKYNAKNSDIAFYENNTKSSWKLLHPERYDVEFYEIPGTEDEDGKCAELRRLGD